MRLLCITDPATHLPNDFTVTVYNRTAEDPRFELFHLDANNVGPDATIPVSPITATMTWDEFLVMSKRPVSPAEYRDFDCIWSRADKPFPPGYLEGLIRREEDTRFVARPSSMLTFDVRSFHRSVAGHFMPPGTMTRDPDEAAQFVQSRGAAVAKRNRSYGGRDVWRIRRDVHGLWRAQQGNRAELEPAKLDALLQHLFSLDPDPWEFVEYQENVSAGDKRILTVEGEIYGSFLRLAPPDSWINNVTSGGSYHRSTVTAGEATVIAATCKTYDDVGLHTLGYDFLLGNSGEWILSEINAGPNIGGYHFAQEVSGEPVTDRLLDWIHRFPSRP
jgi:glutathione synthase/RimK-type ligase-like ATP-grasp enzyme